VGAIYQIISTWPTQSLVLFMTTLAELQFLFANPISGFLLNIATLFILLVNLLRVEAARTDEEAQVSRLNIVLLLIPLMRILSLGLPLTAFPQNYWLLVVAIPLFVAIFLVTRKSPQSWTRQELGLTLNRLPLQLLIPTAGLALGWLQYQLLTPEALATELTWQALWLPALILLISTSCLEELLFRGLLQSAAISVMGRSPAIIFVAALSTILHIGYASLPILAFIFAIGLAFGWFSARTHSIIGVTLTHGLMNISLFLLWPLW
jgi:membrane protease YdiL (CAAX protease family)